MDTCNHGATFYVTQALELLCCRRVCASSECSFLKSDARNRTHTGRDLASAREFRSRSKTLVRGESGDSISQHTHYPRCRERMKMCNGYHVAEFVFVGLFHPLQCAGLSRRSLSRVSLFGFPHFKLGVKLPSLSLLILSETQYRAPYHRPVFPNTRFSCRGPRTGPLDHCTSALCAISNSGKRASHSSRPVV